MYKIIVTKRFPNYQAQIFYTSGLCNCVCQPKRKTKGHTWKCNWFWLHQIMRKNMANVRRGSYYVLCRVHFFLLLQRRLFLFALHYSKLRIACFVGIFPSICLHSLTNFPGTAMIWAHSVHSHANMIQSIASLNSI